MLFLASLPCFFFFWGGGWGGGGVGGGAMVVTVWPAVGTCAHVWDRGDTYMLHGILVNNICTSAYCTYELKSKQEMPSQQQKSAKVL